LAFSCSAANAQGLLNRNPEPADNRAIGLAQGKQLVGLAGKCLTFDNFADSDEAKIRDCNQTAVNQRFKFENGQLKTSAKVLLIVGGDMMGMQYAWENACLSAARDFNRVVLKKCGAVPNAGMQRWDLKGAEIRSGVNCFDVAQSNPANGNVVLYWGCQGQANQRWAMK
jgi:hypothetical protein